LSLLEVPERVLAIGAHPDDVEFGCGATLAKWAASGAYIEILVLTDGSKGTWDPSVDAVTLVAQRRREQQDAARALGVAAARVLDLVDGELDSDRPTRQRVCEVIRQVRPDVVLGHDPWKQYRLHPDHFHAGRLTVDGIVAARDPHFFRESGPPHRPRHLLLFEAQVADHTESVDAFLSPKIEALLCHRSQWRSTMGIDGQSPDADVQREGFTARIRREVESAGGEVFKRIDKL
jgi:LmbE family N-acetylglucosaminyl deacetylase